MNTQVFDLNNDRVIGCIDYKPGVGNASIKVLGWINSEGDVNKVDDSSARKIFSPKGSVFGPSFFVHTNVKEAFKSDNVVFSFYCNQDIPDDPTKDIMKINYEKPMNLLVPILLQQFNDYVDLSRLSNSIDLAENITTFAVYDPLGEVLYPRIRYQNGKVEPFQGKHFDGYKFPKNLFGSNAFKFKSKFFLAVPESLIFKNPDKQVDCMSNEQLGRWFIDRIRNISTISDDTVGLLKAAFEKLNLSLDSELSRVRYQRIKNVESIIQLDYDSVEGLFDSGSYFGTTVKGLLDAKNEEIKQQIFSRFESDIKEKENTILEKESAIQNLHKEIEELDESCKSLLCKYEEQTINIKKLEEQKEQIILTISEAAKLLIGDTSLSKTSRVLEEEKFPIDFLEISAKNFPLSGKDQDVVAFLNNKTDLPLARLLYSRATFIPKAAIAYHFAFTLRNTKLLHISVSPTWFSYEDFCKRGVTSLWESCHDYPTVNHILLIDGINLAVCDAYAKPLLEVINNERPYIPYAKPGKRALPPNLFIFATVVTTRGDNPIGLKLNRDLFSSWDGFELQQGMEWSTSRLNHGQEIYIVPNDYADKRRAYGLLDSEREARLNLFYEK